PDVKFHDGSLVTPQDVKFSLDRVRSKDSNWSWIFSSISSIEATGENQITINLSQPYAPLLSSLALFSASILPEKAVTEKGEEFGNHPIGSGPFMFDEWKRGQSIVLKKNVDYWQKGKPYLDGVEFVQVPEDTTRILKLQSGEVDIASPIPFSSLDQLKADSRLSVSVDPLSRVDMININTTKEPFNDKKIRQAMNYVIDKELIIQSVLSGNGQPSASFLPPMMHFNDQLEGYKRDLEKAKQLMNESSKPNGFKTTLKIGSGDQIALQVAVIAKDQLAEIGIDVEIVQLDNGVKSDQVSKMDYDLAMMLLVSDIIDPDELTTFGVVSTGGINSYYTGYTNEQVNELALKAQGEIDEQKRKEMYFDIQKLVSEDAPFIFLYFTPSTSSKQTYVNGFEVLTTGSYRLEDVWLDK
ncbi:MAG: ABC transporter substrate-binding protein, partial [Bacilli bacterium]